MKFETAWREGYEYFERVLNTRTNESIKRKINVPFEWFEESSTGMYESILDPNIKYTKKQGRSKDGQGMPGLTDPIYRQIRDNYFGTSYNLEPRVWYLDIETRSGRAYKNKGIGNITIRPNKVDNPLEVQVEQLQDRLFNFGVEKFEYLDNNEWKPLSQNFYFQRFTGFPEPEFARERVVMIQIFDSKTQEVIMISTSEWKHKSKYELEYPLQYIQVNSEIELFNEYFRIFKEQNPLVIYAWNGMGFDFPYLHNRIKNIGLNPNLLSNFGEVKLQESEFMGRKEYKFTTPGHFYFDLMEVYKKIINSPRSSYSLDNIVEVELGERKVQHPEYDQFDHFYLGLYNIPENPTEEQKNSEIYQLAIKEGITTEVMELGHSEFCYYSYKDPVLIMKLDKKLNFTGLIFNSAQKMGVLASDRFGTVKPWAQYISNVAIQEMKVLPARQEYPQPNVVGGYVMDPVKGLIEWLLSNDVNSMYPNIMIGYNMSPETYVAIKDLPGDLRDVVLSYFNDQDEEKLLTYPDEVWSTLKTLLTKYNLAMGINGAVFRKDSQGIIPRLLAEIYSERKKTRKIQGKYADGMILTQQVIHDLEGKYGTSSEIPNEITKESLENLNLSALTEVLRDCTYKELQYDTEQLGLKLMINEVYGAFCSRYFPLHSEAIAQAITGNGRFFIRLLGKNAEERLQQMNPSDVPYVKYSDTDSLYYSIAPFVEMFEKANPDCTLDDKVTFCDNFEKKVIEPVIDQTITEITTKLNAFKPDVIGVGREIIADRAVLVAKKKYLARVRDNEGHRYPDFSPELKVMGLDLIKGGTPEWSKRYLTESIAHILDKDEESLRNWLREIKSEYIKADIGEIVQYGTANNLDYDLGEKGVPFGSRAALVHNKYVQDNNLTDIYQLVEPGERSKRIYLKMPNKFNSNIISYISDSFEREIADCIDYDVMFEKCFLNLLENMTNSMDYNLTKETASLDDW